MISSQKTQKKEIVNAEKNFYKIHMNNFQLFEAQDLENGEFDVVFEIDGKSLYAHKFLLSSASTTFKSMLADRWTKANEPIAIKDYSYDDFKKFLTFIYSGECKITDENILSMIDISEFYNVNVFKEICEEYLTKMGLNLNNIFQMLEIGNKYSLSKLTEVINLYILKNTSEIVKTEQFQRLEKHVVKFIVDLNHESLKQEELFEAVYKWAKKVALENGCGLFFTLNEAIKDYLSDILPFFKFNQMKFSFLHNYVGTKSFLFSTDEWRDILSTQSKVVVITDANGKIMKGEIQCDDADNVIQAIVSSKNTNASSVRGFLLYHYWKTDMAKPSTPSKLTKSDKIEWYLFYDGDHLCFTRQRFIDGEEYLIAEMFAEAGFCASDSCKIESGCFV